MAEIMGQIIGDELPEEKMDSQEQEKIKTVELTVNGQKVNAELVEATKAEVDEIMDMDISSNTMRTISGVLLKVIGIGLGIGAVGLIFDSEKIGLSGIMVSGVGALIESTEYKSRQRKIGKIVDKKFGGNEKIE